LANCTQSGIIGAVRRTAPIIIVIFIIKLFLLLLLLTTDVSCRKRKLYHQGTIK